jgi:hypothetical protein
MRKLLTVALIVLALAGGVAFVGGENSVPVQVACLSCG